MYTHTLTHMYTHTLTPAQEQTAVAPGKDREKVCVYESDRESQQERQRVLSRTHTQPAHTHTQQALRRAAPANFTRDTRVLK